MTRRDGTCPASLCVASAGVPFLVWLTEHIRRGPCGEGGTHDATVDVP